MYPTKPSAPAGAPSHDWTTDPYAEPMVMEPELAVLGGDDFGPAADDRYDGAVAMMIRLDDEDDDMETLKDELDMFRRENDFELD